MHTDAWVRKTGSGGASSVLPDSFLIGPLKGHSKLPVTFPPKLVVFFKCVILKDDVLQE